jgi:hypothetical protein
MGSGPTTTQQSNSVTQPWQAAVPQLQGLLGNLGNVSTGVSGNQTNAINSLMGGANGLQSYAPQAGNAANSLFNGGGANNQAGLLEGAYGNLQNSLSPLTNPNNLNPFNTPGFSQAYQTLGNDITNNVNDRFAAAGRDLSPANSTALARGLAQGQGGLIQSQYNQNAANLQGASNSLFGAGANTAQGLTGFNQMGNQNMLAGAGLAGAIPGLAMAPGQAQLQAANLQQNLPLSNLGGYESLLTPIAQLGGQSSGTQTSQTQTPLWQQLAGLGIAGAGLMSGNPMAAMGGMSALGGVTGGGLLSPLGNMNPGSFGGY